MAISEVPRDPGEYSLTIHAQQRRRDRGVDLEEIEAAIRDGEIRNTHQADSRMFVADLSDSEDPLGVVAHIPSGDIKTVVWRDD